MPSLTIENVTLVFPIFSRAQMRKQSVDGLADERLIKSAKGRVRGVRALRDVSVDLKKGDRLALIGSNGSGKTTLLQVMAGILSPDQGRVLVSGRTTNIININLGVSPEATGHRNITLRGLAAGLTLEAIEKQRPHIAEFSRLHEFLDLPVSTYSAGMRMRLNFAIATAFEPEILILDEWLSTGDDDFRRQANQRMEEFVGSAGILALASHNEKLLRKNCNCALWLDRGRVRRFGDIDAVLEEYGENAQTQNARPKPQTLEN